MRNILTATLLLFLTLGIGACKKDIEGALEIAPYTIASLDPDAGEWDPVLLASANDITIAAPEAVSTDAFKAELAATKAASANPSAAQSTAIQYWGGNAVVRWNAIARELAAKYNLPPAADENGNYPVPNAATPNVYPYFPFANPPYASRAFAYLSAAQFDALIVCEANRKKYNRAATYQADPAVKTHLQQLNRPGFPSEDAVIAEVSRRILGFMFPGEVEYLNAKAAEHRNSRIWAGMNVESDLVAGEAIATQVSTVFLDRAKTDGMKDAVGNKAQWDQLVADAESKFNWSWKSMESPARPPMLPNYGKVKPWCIPNVETVRPGPPPALGSQEFKENVEELKRFSKSYTLAQRRIANFWADGPSTHTPPGHWNRIAADLILENKMNLIRSARVYAYMNMAIADAGISCWDTKYYYHYPRPAQTIPEFRNLIGLPNFPAYTSGHSTFSAAGAAVLSHFFKNKTEDSRIYGGIHYRFDCEVGLTVGKNVASYSVVVATQDGAE
jgi:hypothetical protein